MPWASKHPCGAPGCGALVAGAAYCEAHIQQASAAVQRYDHERGSAASRGYDRRWRRFREVYLRQHPLCVDCTGRGAVKAATEVHHPKKVKEHPELMYLESNCMALCHEDHSVRTMRGE